MLGFTNKNSNGDGSHNWYKDKYQYVLVQRNVLAAITFVALLVALFSVFAVMQLTPHKSVEPYVIQIEDRTGIVKKVDPVKRTEFTANEAIDRYFIAKYVRNREGYNPSTISQAYNKIRVSSAKSVFGEYRSASSEANTASPAALLGKEGVRIVEFKSINFLKKHGNSPYGKKTALVRITLIDRSKSRPAPKYYHSLVTITYEYADLPLNDTERYINPLGFTATTYTIETDVVKR